MRWATLHTRSCILVWRRDWNKINGFSIWISGSHLKRACWTWDTHCSQELNKVRRCQAEAWQQKNKMEICGWYFHLFVRFPLRLFSQMINVVIPGLQAVLILVFLVVFFATNSANGGIEKPSTDECSTYSRGQLRICHRDYDIHHTGNLNHFDFHLFYTRSN